MKRRLAYLVNHFPKISETFILDEILDLQRRGLEIEILALFDVKASKTHRQAGLLSGKVHYARFTQWKFWAAQIYWLFHEPSLYAQTWWKGISGNIRSLTFFLRALIVVPAAAYFALLLKERKIDQVHAHWATDPALAAYVIKNLIGIPYSITAHAHDLYVNQTMLKEKLAAAEFIITISDYNKRMLARHGEHILQKIRVIHCGVNPELFQPPIIRNSSTTLTILCVASLSDYKGHRYLIEACASLKAHGVDFRCILAGDGPERNKLKSQVESLNLENHVKFLGWQNRDEIRDLMKNADVFALPSVVTRTGKQEGIPVALMEAMAMEIPIVATSISGIPELVEHGKTGLLVCQRNSAELAAAIFLIYSRPEPAREMAQAARVKVLNEFNLHMSAGRLHRIFLGIPDSPLFETIQRDETDFWQKGREKVC